MLRSSSETALLHDICRILVNAGGYRLAWVGYAEHDDGLTVTPMAYEGAGAEYMLGLRVSWGDNTHGHGPTGTAIRTGKEVVAQNVLEDPNYGPWRQDALRNGYGSSIALPLIFNGAVGGALNIYGKDPNAFDQGEIALLKGLAGNIAYGITSLRARSERHKAQEALLVSWATLRRTLYGVVRAMATVTELCDPYTAGHQQRVSELACLIARGLDFDQEEVEGIRIAGVVHDIGKVYVPGQILSKPGRLTPAEFSLIKEHCRAGYDILKPIEFPWPIADTVLQHHERMDGSGYPYGLTGQNILMQAKIVAVADVVEAMSCFRPYRPAPGIERALEEVSSGRGALYDPDVVDVCLEVFSTHQFRFLEDTVGH